MSFNFDQNKRPNVAGKSALTPRILVLGSYVHANCLLLKRLPEPGESLSADGWVSEHGGKGLNVIVGLHKLGIQTIPIVAIGRDEAGDRMLAWYRAMALDDSYVYRLGDQSGYGVGLIAANGQNMIAVYPGANNLLAAEHIELPVSSLEVGDWVYGQFEIADEPIMVSFRYAKQRGCTTVLNPSPWRQVATELMALTDILLINQQEAHLLTGMSFTEKSISQSGQQIQNWLQQQACPGLRVILTLAGQGALAVSQQETLYQPAFKINALDATGAGDAFAAGLIGSLSLGQGLGQALLEACACGALTAAQLGVWQVLPTSFELEAWLTDQSSA
ncbi:MAG: PfkB family carbohydrate kinase [Methylococcaceae bacterium]|jgi:ribokinase